MTFAVTLANADQVIQVSDRRLTWNGKLVEDASNKAGHLLCDDASLLYCFTGIASTGNHLTSRWLLEAIQAASLQNPTYRELVESFAVEATRYFSTSPDIALLRPSQRGLTVMFTGYTAGQFIVNLLVSNFQDFTNFVNHPEAKSEFTVHAEISVKPATNNPTVIQAIGQFHAMNETDEQEIREMLVRRVPAEALRQKAISLVQDISTRPKSAGTVGRILNTARLQFTDPLIPYAGYATDKVESEISLLDQVDGRSKGTKLLVSNVKITAGSPIVFPKVHRNAPCPCGSGIQYKFCHRK